MYSPFVVSHPHYPARKFPPDRQFGPILFHLQKKSIFPVKISRLPRLGLGKDTRGRDRGRWEFFGRRASFPSSPGKKAGAKTKKGREKSSLLLLLASAKRRLGRGIRGLKRLNPALGKK
jgi:hypothetical protein